MSNDQWDHLPELKASSSNEIFVFGANEAGRHGKGAALSAKRHYGAIYGQGYGRQGMSFGIPTKDARLKTLSLAAIEKYVMGFLTYAKDHPELYFRLTAIGCGLAGYMPEDIAPMFVGAPDNVYIPEAFKEVLS